MMKKKFQLMRGAVQSVFMLMAFAGLYFGFRMNFKYVMFLSLIAGNFFCGWICPYGTLQEIFGKIGDKVFKRKYKMPYGVQKYLQFTRYIIYIVLMIEVVKEVFSPYDSYKVFIMSVGKLSEVSFTTAFIIMISFPLVSMVFERPFCNYFCTESFGYTARSITRIFTIKRNEKKCINCRICDRVCPMNIEVSATKKMRSLQCINCFKCIGKCPVNGALDYGSILGRKRSEGPVVTPQNSVE